MNKLQMVLIANVAAKTQYAHILCADLKHALQIVNQTACC